MAQGDGRIIIMTIHQPSSQIFYQFDRLLLMASGRQAYFGPSADAMAKFEAMGLRCERQFNPADYLLDVLSDTKEQGRILTAYTIDPLLQKEIDSLADRARDFTRRAVILRAAHVNGYGMLGALAISRVQKEWASREDLRTQKETAHAASCAGLGPPSLGERGGEASTSSSSPAVLASISI